MANHLGHGYLNTYILIIYGNKDTVCFPVATWAESTASALKDAVDSRTLSPFKIPVSPKREAIRERMAKGCLWSMNGAFDCRSCKCCATTRGSNDWLTQTHFAAFIEILNPKQDNPVHPQTHGMQFKIQELLFVENIMMSWSEDFWCQEIWLWVENHAMSSGSRLEGCWLTTRTDQPRFERLHSDPNWPKAPITEKQLVAHVSQVIWESEGMGQSFSNNRKRHSPSRKSNVEK